MYVSSPMNEVLLVDGVECKDTLASVELGHFLRERIVFNEKVHHVASRKILHDQVKVFRILGRSYHIILLKVGSHIIISWHNLFGNQVKYFIVIIKWNNPAVSLAVRPGKSRTTTPPRGCWRLQEYLSPREHEQPLLLISRFNERSKNTNGKK